MKKSVLLFITFVFVGMISVIGCSKEKTSKTNILDFEQMITFSFNGLNGKGVINTSPNMEKYNDKKFLKRLFPDETQGKSSETLSVLMSKVSYTFTEENNLSNGDEIEVIVQYDTDIFKEYNITVKNDKFKIKVEGLENGTVIDAFDGLSITYSGLSGKGIAVLDASNCHEFVQNYVSFNYSEKNLSNGDKIEVAINYDNNIAYKNSIIIENETKEFIVQGLDEAIEIDPFEKLEITYTGASPYIKAMADSTKCDSIVNQYIQFNIEDKYLKNGDTFTVTAIYNEYDAEEYGFIITNDTKTYTVENQPEYVTSLDGLDLTELQAELNDKLTVATTANEGDSNFSGVYLWWSFKSVAEKKYRTSYLVSLKTNFEDKFDNGYNYNYNRYIQIYEYTINTKEEQKKVYVAVYVNNICKNSDGTISWDIELGSMGDENYDTIVNKFATSEKEFYNVSEVKIED